VVRRFFETAVNTLANAHAVLAEKLLRKANPHWIRHAYASHALTRGAELTIMRDNRRHVSVSTTSINLHSDGVKRARQLRRLRQNDRWCVVTTTA